MTNLPCAAINYANSQSPDASFKNSARQLINDMLKRTRTRCAVEFLKNCLQACVVPLFILALFSEVPTFEEHVKTQALDRKMKSTQLELVRCQIATNCKKLEDLERDIGYAYFNITRYKETNVVETLLHKTEDAVRQEEQDIYQRHNRKWYALTGKNYCDSCDNYFAKLGPRLPFACVDDFWFRRERSPNSLSRQNNQNLNDQISNESTVVLPSKVLDLLSKGPNFRIPPILDEKFLEHTSLDLDVFSYKFRWHFHSKDKPLSPKIQIPFKRNTVAMPNPLPKDLEDMLTSLKQEVQTVTKTAVKKMKNNKVFRDTQNQVRKTRNFLNSKELVAIPSDKSNRLVISDSKTQTDRNLSLLSDKDVYQPLEQSRQHKIEKQANNLTKSVCKALPKFDREKMIISGSKPAQFFSFVKDHKTKLPDVDHFPLRPIASAKNTATEKLDWLITQVLVQLVHYVPANIKNSDDIITILQQLETHDLTCEHTFVSLDVKNLYPSIPIEWGIKTVIDFAKTHWHKIDTFTLTIENFKKCLCFISYNYEIEYEGRFFLQKLGCPMGAHFAPPYAIIVMHLIETQALSCLEENLISPKIYKRYIDDCILGPFPRNNDMFNQILNAFNSVNDKIQFTMDIPDLNCPLNFLDISINIIHQKIDYSWYTKPCRSDITLRQDSWLPSHVKNNFLTQSVKNVEKKCSNSTNREFSFNILKSRIKNNGYNNFDPHRSLQRLYHKKEKKEKDTDYKVPLVLDFVSDSHSRHIRKILSKYDQLPIQLVTKTGKQLKDCFKNRPKTVRHGDCDVCKKLEDKYICSDRFLVYKFTCNICQDSYIGQTARPFKQRFTEHKYSLNRADETSALSTHALKAHGDVTLDIDSFSLRILFKGKTPLETRLIESKMIRTQQPNLNRKHELV